MLIVDKFALTWELGLSAITVCSLGITRMIMLQIPFQMYVLCSRGGCCENTQKIIKHLDTQSGPQGITITNPMR